MQYKITNMLSSDEQTDLKSLVNKQIVVKGEFAGDYLLGFSVECNSMLLYINQKHKSKEDNIDFPHNEYPQFHIQRENTIEYRYVLPIAKVDLTDISIVRDYVSWEFRNKHWDVISDVAIKFYFKEKQLIFWVVDSLAGFIKYEFKDNTTPTVTDEKEMLEHWSLHTDKFTYFKRAELFL